MLKCTCVYIIIITKHITYFCSLPYSHSPLLLFYMTWLAHYCSSYSLPALGKKNKNNVKVIWGGLESRCVKFVYFLEFFPENDDRGSDGRMCTRFHFSIMPWLSRQKSLKLRGCQAQILFPVLVHQHLWIQVLFALARVVTFVGIL